MNSSTPSSVSPERIDLPEILQIILTKFWVILFCLLASFSLGLLYVRMAPRIYEATATVQVEQANQKIVKIEEVSSEDLRDVEILKTIEQNFLHKSLILRVVKGLHLKGNPEFASLVKKARDKNEDPENAIASELCKKSLDVHLRRRTRLIDIVVDLKNPILAANLANAIADEFMQKTAETRYGDTQAAFHFLMEEVDRLKAKLSASELALQNYWSAMLLKNRIIDQEKVIDHLSQRYLEKHPKLIQAKSLLYELQVEFVKEMNKISKNTSEKVDPLSLNEKTTLSEEKFDQELQRAESKFNVLILDVETDRALYDSILQRLKETDVTKGLFSFNVRIVERASVPEKPIKPQIRLSLGFSIFVGPILGMILIFLLHTFDSSLKTVDDTEKYLDLPVLGVIPDAKTDEMLQCDPSTVHGLRWRFQRLVGSFFTSPQKKVQAYNVLPPTIRKATMDFLYSFKENIISPFRIRSFRKRSFFTSAQYPLVLIRNPSCKVSESLRTLRVNLSLLDKKSNLFSFLFTSSVPFEGKSFMAANFAVSLAQQNYQTLLIDADLRRPTINHYFEENANEGLTDYFLERRSFEEVLKPTMQKNLHVMTAGSICPNPAELLEMNDFSELLAHAKDYFDRVVIDSAPIHAVGDTLLIASKVQHVCLVVHAMETPRRPVKRACMQLENANAHLAGIVLNHVPEESGFICNPYYYHYQRDHGYGKIYAQC